MGKESEVGMNSLEKVINDLNVAKHILCNPQMLTPEMCVRIGQAITSAIDQLKEQEAKTGTWQWKIHGKPESGGTLGEAVCDQCGKSTYATAVKGTLNYCPNCGANMMDRR